MRVRVRENEDTMVFLDYPPLATDVPGQASVAAWVDVTYDYLVARLESRSCGDFSPG